jgi:hypothetical protein
VVGVVPHSVEKEGGDEQKGRGKTIKRDKNKRSERKRREGRQQ